jgi:adenine-specific DNA methylase
VNIRKKLIEVSIPLEAINAASAKEKQIKTGKPLQIHHYWARRPLATCRAVLFAQLVDDPSCWPDHYPFPNIANTEEAGRRRLRAIIADLVNGRTRTMRRFRTRRGGKLLARLPGVVARSPRRATMARRSLPICRRGRPQSMSRSAGAAQFHWRRSGSDCGPTART